MCQELYRNQRFKRKRKWKPSKTVGLSWGNGSVWSNMCKNDKFVGFVHWVPKIFCWCQCLCIWHFWMHMAFLSFTKCVPIEVNVWLANGESDFMCVCVCVWMWRKEKPNAGSVSAVAAKCRLSAIPSGWKVSKKCGVYVCGWIAGGKQQAVRAKVPMCRFWFACVRADGFADWLWGGRQF